MAKNKKKTWLNRPPQTPTPPQKRNNAKYVRTKSSSVRLSKAPLLIVLSSKAALLLLLLRLLLRRGWEFTMRLKELKEVCESLDGERGWRVFLKK